MSYASSRARGAAIFGIMAIRIVAAEDSYLIREGMRLLLATQPDLDLVASVTTLPDLLAAVDEHAPDVVVTDIRMPPGDQDEGIQAAETLARTHPGLGVVVLSQYVEPEWALRPFDPRARGRAYLLKERVGDLRRLRNAIETVSAGGSVLDPLVVEALVHARTQRGPGPGTRPDRVGALHWMQAGRVSSRESEPSLVA